MDNLVMKFGGSSVSTIEKIKSVAKKIVNNKIKYKNIVVVVSAMGDTTDHYLGMVRSISKRPNKREMDVLLSTGEQISTSLLAMAIEELGYMAKSFTGGQAGIMAQGNYMNGKVESVDISKLLEALEEGYICIVAGFQGLNNKGDVITLGRGGSDISAVALAARLKSPCHIYTDVNGIYTVDPRIFKESKKIDYLSYDEMIEMAYLGAKILEPRSVFMAKRFGVDLYIAMASGSDKGTYIVEEDFIVERRDISNVSLKDDTLLVNMEVEKGKINKISDLFLEMSDRDVNIEMINQTSSENRKPLYSFISDINCKGEVQSVLDKYGLNYEYKNGVSKISIIGSGMRNQPKISSKIFKIFSDNDIPFYQVFTSDISISYIIDSHNNKKIVNVLANEFGL